jgi:hypothetical protein
MPEPAVESTQPTRSRARAVANAAALIWLFLPAVVIARGASSLIDIRMDIIRWLIGILAFVTVLAVVLPLVGRIAGYVILAVLAVYCTLCTLLAAYRAWMHERLDVAFVISWPAAALKTFWIEAGPLRAVLIAVALVVIAALFGWSLRTLAGVDRVGLSRSRGIIVAVVFIVALASVGGTHATLMQEYETFALTAEPLPPPLVFDYSPFDLAGATDNVVFLQEESINAIAMNGERVVDGHAFNGDYLPGTRDVARHGILFPYFWAHDIVTHRAQETILCGSVRNFRHEYVDTQSPRTTPCMPELFKKAGYRTIFLSAYEDGTFYHTDAFMNRIGFDELHFADFMRDDDPRSVWGFDEAPYYKRALAYIRKRFRPDEKLFIYIATSANHAGFARGPERETIYYTLPVEKQLTQYLWSARKQDAALSDFYADYRSTVSTWKPTHLFIVADHSFPLGMYGRSMPQSGVSVDNFLTMCMYVPPESRAGEYAVGTKMEHLFGQSDLMPTLSELLTHKPRQNSIVPFMKREPAAAGAPYEPCYVMTQPYGGGFVFIARGRKGYVYGNVANTITTFDLLENPTRQVATNVERDVSYAHFEAKYGCRRYHRHARS